jgi:thiamine biosynthesis lipoprotein
VPVTGTLRIDVTRSRVIVPPGGAIDLGGIAKSWSAVRAGRLLERTSSGSVLLDAGGDIVAVRGDHVVDVASTGERVTLRQGEGVATSGFGRRQWQNGDGVDANHLIDPATGAPAGRAHATVVAADAVTADVLATSLVVCPTLISDRDEACIVVDELGTSVSTRRWAEVAA